MVSTAVAAGLWTSRNSALVALAHVAPSDEAHRYSRKLFVRLEAVFATPVPAGRTTLVRTLRLGPTHSMLGSVSAMLDACPLVLS
jgi:hypothetical protein